MYRKLSFVTLITSVLALFGCSDPTSGPEPTESLGYASQGPELTRAQLRGLARYTPRARQPGKATEAEWIGPGGGTLEFGDIELVVPAGAVESSTRFWITLPQVNSPQATYVHARFGPENTTFQHPVRAVFPFESTNARAGRPQGAWWDRGEWVDVPTQLTDRGKAELTLTHFSSYGIFCVPVEDPDLSEEACRTAVPDSGASLPGIYNGWSYDQCTDVTALWFVDADSDGVDDYCETDLAHDFRPEMVFSQDCNWDYGLNRMGGEYYWATADYSQDRIKTLYMPAYYHDCGAGAGIEDHFAGPHTGDSEYVYIIHYFEAQDNHWQTEDTYLSAHCGTDNDEHCTWQAPSEYQYWVDGVSVGAPVVWVSVGKHANYANKDECQDEVSKFGLEVFPGDDCVGIATASLRRFPVSTSRNVGSYGTPLVDCVGAVSGSSMTDSGIVECFWSDPPIRYSPYPELRFNGWQSEVDGDPPPPYNAILALFGF